MHIFIGFLTTYRWYLVLFAVGLAASLPYNPTQIHGALEVVKEPTLVKIVLMLAAMSMHLSYWGSGIHSRAYRLEQYKLGFATKLPATSKLIAVLNATGRSDLADAVVVSILTNSSVSDEILAELELTRSTQLLLQAAQKELDDGRVLVVSS